MSKSARGHAARAPPIAIDTRNLGEADSPPLGDARGGGLEEEEEEEDLGSFSGSQSQSRRLQGMARLLFREEQAYLWSHKLSCKRNEEAGVLTQTHSCYKFRL